MQNAIRGLAVSFVLFTSYSAWADISGATGCSPTNCVLVVEGRITSTDVQHVRQAFDQSKGRGDLMLMLDSEGGDLAAAIEIGRLIRRWTDSSVIVSLNSRCFSACVFVLAGGLHRTVHGKIGIHRPYGTGPKVGSYESTQKEFRAIEQTAKRFLQDVNIPVSLFDEMMSVPPEKLRILTEGELARYGIGQNDPIYEEVRDDQAAKALNISKEEYLRRKNRSERICNALTVNERKAGLSASDSELAYIFAACKTAVLQAKSDSAVTKTQVRGAKAKQ